MYTIHKVCDDHGYLENLDEGNMIIFCARLSVALVTFSTIGKLERKMFPSFPNPQYSISLKEVNVGTQGRNTDAGTEAEAMKKDVLFISCSA